MNLLLRSILLLLALQLALLQLASPLSASAQTPNPQTYLEPGFYRGFVTLILHSDDPQPLQMQGSGATANIEYEGVWIQRTGLLELDVGEDQVGYGQINLNPILAAMEYFVSLSTPVGNCTWGASWTGEMRHASNTAGKKMPVSDSIYFTMPFQDVRTSSFNFYKASGSMQGCDKRGTNAIWQSLLTYSKFHSRQITELYLVIKNHPNPGVVNGTCTVKGWDKSEPVAGGTFVRDTPACSWYAWKDSSYLSGWTWSDSVKRKGRK
jgi:hypothetical protein